MSLRASPNTLRGSASAPHTCRELDFVDEHATRLACLGCRTIRVIFMDPRMRAATLRTLLERGELRGRAEAEAEALP